MSQKSQVAAREGWFTLDAENPRLLGSQCDECKTYYFPVHSQYCRNPACDSEHFTTLELSQRGKIWSYTNAGYAPPSPFISEDPHEVFAIAAVELEKEQLVVMGQMIKGVCVEDLNIGDEVELTLDTLFEEDNQEVIVWKWRPVKHSLNTVDEKGGAA